MLDSRKWQGTIPASDKVRRRKVLVRRPNSVSGDRRRIVKAAALSAPFLLLALFGKQLAPDDINDQDLVNRLQPPVGFGGSWTHVLGTDYLGRDVLSRVIGGASVSLLIAAAVVSITIVVGCLVGLIAGYFGGVVDGILMRLTDAMIALPTLIVTLVLLAAVGPSLWTEILALSICYWMLYAQVARTTVLSLKGSGYVEAARISGVRTHRIIIRHILPGLAGPTAVLVPLEYAKVLLADAGLSFLGFGVQPPSASWGLDIATAQPYIQSAWWLITFPGIALVVTVICVYKVGDLMHGESKWVESADRA